MAKLGHPSALGTPTARLQDVEGVAPAHAEKVLIHAVPVVFVADTPATATVTRSMGHSAIRLCHRCNIAKPPNPPDEKAPLGYATTTLQRLPGSQQEVEVTVWDDRMKLSHEQIMSRGAPHTSGWSTQDPAAVGCHGQPLLPLKLPWLDARYTHLVAVDHLLLYGLLKHFLEWIMSAVGLPLNVRQKLIERGILIQAPSYFGRALCSIGNRSGWRMEDFKHFVMYFAPIFFHDNILPWPFNLLWANLEKTCRHYLTPGTETSATLAGMAAGHDHLQRFANLLEECRLDPQLPADHFDNDNLVSVPSGQISPNLHTTSCRLKEQEQNVGRTNRLGELWVERKLHDMKTITTAGIPGPQLDAHITVAIARHNSSAFVHDRAAPAAQPGLKARLQDAVTQEGQQALLLGAGSTVSPLQNSPGALMQGCIKAVQELRFSNTTSSRHPRHVKLLFGEALTPEEEVLHAAEPLQPAVPGAAPAMHPVLFYTRAECNGTTVLSRTYPRTIKINSTWVSLPFATRTNSVVIWAGHIQFFVRLEHPKQPGVFLRLAVTRMFKTRPTSHPFCFEATGLAKAPAAQVPGAGVQPGAEAGAEQLAQGATGAGASGSGAGDAGTGGLMGPAAGRSQKRPAQVAEGENVVLGSTRKSARLAAPSSQRQAAQAAPAAAQPQPPPPPLGGMHKGFGDQHWYMYDASRIHNVFVSSFPDGEEHGRMLFVAAHSLSRS